MHAIFKVQVSEEVFLFLKSLDKEIQRVEKIRTSYFNKKT